MFMRGWWPACANIKRPDRSAGSEVFEQKVAPHEGDGVCPAVCVLHGTHEPQFEPRCDQMRPVCAAAPVYVQYCTGEVEQMLLLSGLMRAVIKRPSLSCFV